MGLLMQRLPGASYDPLKKIRKKRKASYLIKFTSTVNVAQLSIVMSAST